MRLNPSLPELSDSYTQLLESNPISYCPMCGDDSESARNSAYEYSVVVPGAAVCFSCAEKIANAFWMKHSGEWLTRENPPAAPRRPGPRKETITPGLRKKVFERDAYRCCQCGSYKDLQCDHMLPESKGGKAVIENLQTLCKSCNCRKGARA
jgi:5-methylcytosine-specific restriction endonuclease McrA